MTWDAILPFVAPPTWSSIRPFLSMLRTMDREVGSRWMVGTTFSWMLTPGYMFGRMGCLPGSCWCTSPGRRRPRLQLRWRAWRMGNEKIGVSGLGRWVACMMDTFRCVLVPQVPHRASVSEQVSVGPRGCARWSHRICVNTSEPAFEVTLTQLQHSLICKNYSTQFSFRNCDNSKICLVELAKLCRMRERLNPPLEFQSLDTQFGWTQTGSIMHKKGWEPGPGIGIRISDKFWKKMRSWARVMQDERK